MVIRKYDKNDLQQMITIWNRVVERITDRENRRGFFLLTELVRRSR